MTTDCNDRPVILFVDDDPAVLASLRDALRKEAFEILTSTSPADALALLACHDVDVVVSDERMPGGSGSEFLHRVGQMHPNIPLIMLTGEADVATNARSIARVNMYRFLCKPIRTPDLTQILRQAYRMKGLLQPTKGPASKSELAKSSH